MDRYIKTANKMKVVKHIICAHTDVYLINGDGILRLKILIDACA